MCLSRGCEIQDDYFFLYNLAVKKCLSGCLARFLVASVVVTLSVVSPAGAIFGGVPDSTTNNVVVALHRDGYMPRCTGTLVAPTWVVTAAHCIWNDSVGGVDPYVTQLRVSTTSGFAGTSQATSVIRSAIPHPNYTSWRSGYDLALLKVDDVFGGKFVALASLEEIKSYGDTYSSVIASGFGLTSENGSVSKIALEVSLTMRPQNVCASSLPNSFASISSSIICVTGDASRATCSGDSGGPLFLNTAVGRKLAGATSFGDIPCSSSRTFFTNVVAFSSFLSDYGIGTPVAGVTQVTVPAVLPPLPNATVLPPSSPILQSPILPTITGINSGALPKFSISRIFQLVLIEKSKFRCSVDIDGSSGLRDLRFSIFVGKKSNKPTVARTFNEFGDATFELPTSCNLIRSQGIFVMAENSNIRVKVIE